MPRFDQTMDNNNPVFRLATEAAANAIVGHGFAPSEEGSTSAEAIKKSRRHRGESPATKPVPHRVRSPRVTPGGNRSQVSHTDKGKKPRNAFAIKSKNLNWTSDSPRNPLGEKGANITTAARR
eukprot:TRINITY_DN16120_c0_g1_i1.p2 TRINITY_DN16120_c0_g1~~TRINITY_DN16120_c0_g1_i1.p2  ORF type:complete len:123 (-),score=20.89 TRINITY_DN16120_c0_g1_i1:535-903(-)